jgi:AcrR family transcriptional regulator
MPKVSEAYRDQRREQILHAALKCVATKGFHQTSMREICREAGLSFGAVYNYFRSKEEILAALTEIGREGKGAQIEKLEDCATAREALARLFQLVFAAYGDVAFRVYAPVDVECYSEALRNPQVFEIMRRELVSLHQSLSVLVTGWKDANALSPEIDTGYLAHYLIALSIGIKIQLLMVPELDAERLERLVTRVHSEGIWTSPDQGCGRA